MRHAQVLAKQGTTQFYGSMRRDVTGERLFRAGECVAAGEYVETETQHHITLTSPDFLPVRLDGHVAYYRLMQRGWGEQTEPMLVQRQMQFQGLVAQTRQRLYRFALHTLGNPQDAEDVTQEALARAWTHFETFDPLRSFEAWVSQIVRNLVIDQCRRRRCRQEISLDTPTTYLSGNEDMRLIELSDSIRDPLNCLMAKEISAELQSALRSLPPLHQATLLLVAQERSYEQIARTFDCPLGTVRSRVHRARLMLRRNLKASTTHE